MAKFNLKSVYSADKPYTVVEELNKFVDYIDNIEYVAPGEYTRLFRHEVVTVVGENEHVIKFYSTRSNPYVLLDEFIADLRRFYLDPTGKSPTTLTHTYSSNFYFVWLTYSTSSSKLYLESLGINLSNISEGSFDSTEITSVVSDVVTLL